MAYLALYREWRPRTFQEIVGQKHVTQTLINALAQDKVAHAYLFSGPRGTGKTTAAKILAKALNCDARVGVEPCNSCDSCIGIDRGIAMEVMEIDAASNRGIDEIRDLREKVRLSAARGKVKVYIIDEVHMLTTEAFNALLKTLEEPPQRVVFILATTEVQKIPLTILSRVQRFEFYRVALVDIITRLTEVVTALGRQVDPVALQVIAQKSEGGLRDALSILDQCLVQDDPLGVEQVYQVLGMVGETFSSQVFEAFLEADYGKALSTLSQGIEQGRDPRQILRELLEYLRQALLFLTTQQAPLIVPHLMEKLIQQSQSSGLDRLLLWIEVLLKGESQLKYATNARLATELIIIEAIHKSHSLFNEAGQFKDSIPITHQETKVNTLEVTNSPTPLRRQVVNEPAKHGQETTRVDSKHSRVNEVEGKFSGNNIGDNEDRLRTIDPVRDKEEVSKSEDNEDITLEQIVDKWTVVLENVRKRKKSTHAFLLEGKPGRLEKDRLILVFKNGFSFHRDKVDQVENRQTIQEVLRQLFGINLTLQGIMENEQETELKPDPEEDRDRLALIKRTQDIFGPELVVIKED